MSRKAPYFVAYWFFPGEAVEWTPMYVDNNGSHISQEALIERGLSIPRTPDLKTYQKLVREKKRCSICFKTIATRHADMAYHKRVEHGVVA